MSSSIAPADLSAATVGAKGNMTWDGFGMPTATGRPAKLVLYNESGCGLRCRLFGSGRSFELPAGGWFQDPLELQANESGLDFTVEDIIPNQLVAKLKGTYISPGEQFVSVSLGNSPIGISGSVSTTNIQSLANDGNVPGTSIVEATPSDQASSSVSLNNDASGFLQVLSANVLRKILNVVRGNSGAAKAAITLGDSGDTSITTLYGILGAGSVVPPATLAAGAIPAGVTIPGSQVSSTVANATSATDAGTVGAAMTGRDDPTNHFYGPSPALKPASIPRGFNIEVWDGAASHFPSLLDGAGNWLQNIPGSAVSSAVASAQKLIGVGQTDGLTSTDDSLNKITRLVPTPALQRDVMFRYVNSVNAQADGPVISNVSAAYHVPGQWRDAPSALQYPIATTFVGTGAGTYTHAMGPLGITPRGAFICPNQVNSTQTVGVDTLGTTTVHVNMPSSWPFYGMAILC